MNSNFKQSQQGFGLLEVLCVLSIIVVLLFVTSHFYTKHLTKANVATAVSFMGSMKPLIIKNIMENKSCGARTTYSDSTGTVTILGTPSAKTLVDGSPDATGCRMTYAFSNNANYRTTGKSLTMVLLNNGGLAVDPSLTTLSSEFTDKFPTFIDSPSSNIPSIAESHPTLNTEQKLPTLTSANSDYDY